MSPLKTEKTDIWIIAGPTASGKTQLSLQLARDLNGAVINADSMQIYREIPILSAQPTQAEQGDIPHYLYGFLPITETYSASDWAKQAVTVIDTIQKEGRTPILVGGSGLYLKALMEGFSPMPEVPASIRKQIIDLYDMLGPSAFHKALKEIDPKTAAKLHATDRQRNIRAREIYEVSGIPLSVWQEKPKKALAPHLNFRLRLVMPPRAALYERINCRFEQMIEAGAMKEAHAVHALSPSPELTGTKALGLQSLRDVIEGRLTLNEAIEQAQTLSRQYAKRQYTWFRPMAEKEG